MYVLKSEKRENGLFLPTSINEFTPVILEDLTKDIKLGNHRCVIAQCMKISLFELAYINSNNKGNNVYITPIIAKVNNPDNNENSFNPIVGEKAIIPASVVERGDYVYVNCGCTSSTISNFIEHNEDVRVDLLKKGYVNNLIFNNINDFTKDDIIKDNSKNVYIIEFKIVPLSAISGTTPVVTKPTKHFIVKTNKAN